MKKALLASLLLFGCLVAGSIDASSPHSTLHYALRYGVATNKVTVDPEPNDCKFFSAPIGEKNCYRVVTTVRWGTDVRTGTPIYSDDGGTTWHLLTPDPGVKVPKSSTVESVEVGWDYGSATVQ